MREGSDPIGKLDPGDGGSGHGDSDVFGAFFPTCEGFELTGIAFALDVDEKLADGLAEIVTGIGEEGADPFLRGNAGRERGQALESGFPEKMTVADAEVRDEGIKKRTIGKE